MTNGKIPNTTLKQVAQNYLSKPPLATTETKGPSRDWCRRLAYVIGWYALPVYCSLPKDHTGPHQGRTIEPTMRESHTLVWLTD